MTWAGDGLKDVDAQTYTCTINLASLQSQAQSSSLSTAAAELSLDPSVAASP